MQVFGFEHDTTYGKPEGHGIDLSHITPDFRIGDPHGRTEEAARTVGYLMWERVLKEGKQVWWDSILEIEGPVREYIAWATGMRDSENPAPYYYMRDDPEYGLVVLVWDPALAGLLWISEEGLEKAKRDSHGWVPEWKRGD